MAKRDPLDNFIKLNIGLKKGQTNQDVPLSDVHDQLAKHGFTTTRERVVTKQRAGGEPTAVIHARHTMPQADAEKAVHDMSGALGQDAIAYKNNHKGVLSGPRKENYGGHFNKKYFIESGVVSESRADEIPGYLHRIGVETGNDLHFYKAARGNHGDPTRHQDHVFYLGAHSIPDEMKTRIQSDYPEAKFGTVTSSLTPERSIHAIIIPGAKKRIHEDRLDELSPDTLASYLRWATIEHGGHSQRLGQEVAQNIAHDRDPEFGDRYAKADKETSKRFHGIQTAINKLRRKAVHEDHVSRGDRVSVSDPEGDWTGRVFKPGRDSLFGGGASREDSMHQITPDPQHANRFPRSVVSVHPDTVHRVYEDHLDEISVESLRNYMDAAIRNELDATHSAQDLRKQHHQRSIRATLTTDHRGNKLKSDMQALIDRAARRRKGVGLARERMALQTEGKDQ